jgi:hypothetical protein
MLILEHSLGRKENRGTFYNPELEKNRRSGKGELPSLVEKYFYF